MVGTAYSSLSLEQLDLAVTRPGHVIKFHGVVSVRRLNSDERRRYEMAKTTGVIETNKQIDWDYAYNAFWYWCEIMDRPFVQVSKARKYADVQIDCGSTFYRELDKEHTEVIRDELVSFSSSGEGWYGPVICSAKRVRIEDAESLASWLAVYGHAHATRSAWMKRRGYTTHPAERD